MCLGDCVVRYWSATLDVTSSNLLSIIVLLPPANEVWGKVIFSVACVHRGEYLSRFPPGQVHLPWAGNPPWAGTLPRQVHPPPGTPPWAATSPQAATPLGTVHAGGYGQQAGSTHPTWMHSCLLLNSAEVIVTRYKTSSYLGWIKSPHVVTYYT